MLRADHLSRVIDAFVARLDLCKFGFAKASAAATGRPSCDPADLLKFYVYGYLQQVRSSRRLEAECKRNAEVMWLVGRLAPDRKTIAEFHRTQGEAQGGAVGCGTGAPGGRRRALTEPEARMMQGTKGPACNLPSEADARHGVIVAHAVTWEVSDNRWLQPLAEAALAS